jgi:nucleotide-binding universal stress UspA family protein
LKVRNSGIAIDHGVWSTNGILRTVIEPIGSVVTEQPSNIEWLGLFSVSKETPAVDGWARSLQQTILVPVDDSEQSRKALAVAATDFDDAEIIILYVLKPYVVKSATESAVWDDEFMDNREQEAKQTLEEYQQLATEYGLDVRAEFARGSPTRAIGEARNKFDVDHIILGYSGKTTLARVLLHYVTKPMMRQSPISITLV